MSIDDPQKIIDELRLIRLALTGDPALGHRGLVSRVNNLEKGFLVVAGMAIAVGGQQAWHSFLSLFH